MLWFWHVIAIFAHGKPCCSVHGTRHVFKPKLKAVQNNVPLPPNQSDALTTSRPAFVVFKMFVRGLGRQLGSCRIAKRETRRIEELGNWGKDGGAHESSRQSETASNDLTSWLQKVDKSRVERSILSRWAVPCLVHGFSISASPRHPALCGAAGSSI